jgi:DNA-binding CsgD family transcriptional regulator
LTPQAHALGAARPGWSQHPGRSAVGPLRLVRHPRRPGAAALHRTNSGGTGEDGGCPLSAREFEVLRLMALEGLQTEGIAQRLGVTASTVRQHCQNAYRRLGVTHAVQALVVCFNAGWIDPVQTRIQDPLRFSDDEKWEPTPAQRVYLDAFDDHLRAGDDERALLAAKRKTDAALVALDQPWRSMPSRDWIDELLSDMAAVGRRRG